MLDKVGKKWNVFAIDLKNEPHGEASWGDSHPATDWNKAAERIIQVMRQNKYNSIFQRRKSHNVSFLQLCYNGHCVIANFAAH